MVVSIELNHSFNTTWYMFCMVTTPLASASCSILIYVRQLRNGSENKREAVTEAEKEYEPLYVAHTICTVFSWFTDQAIHYKCGDFTGIELLHFVSYVLFPYLHTY
jgi:hypothetical protein